MQKLVFFIFISIYCNYSFSEITCPYTPIDNGYVPEATMAFEGTVEPVCNDGYALRDETFLPVCNSGTEIYSNYEESCQVAKCDASFIPDVSGMVKFIIDDDALEPSESTTSISHGSSLAPLCMLAFRYPIYDGSFIIEDFGFNLTGPTLYNCLNKQLIPVDNTHMKISLCLPNNLRLDGTFKGGHYKSVTHK